MNIKIANAMFGYLETLYNMNQIFMRLCGIDIMNDSDYRVKDVLDIIQDIPRIVPYSYCNRTKKLELSDKDGLLEYKTDIIYLCDEYKNILDSNYEFLEKVRKIRNKYEHRMHGIENNYLGSSNDRIFEYSFEIKGADIDVNANDFMKLLKPLNLLFDRIVLEMRSFAIENKKDEYAYYKRICRFNFKDFNDIYESDLLIKIGKSMRSF